MRCDRCGADSSDQAQFCRSCGTPLSRTISPIGSPSEGGDQPDARGHCTNGHACGSGESCCGLCGAPRVANANPSGNGTKGSGEPEPISQGGNDPSRRDLRIWMLGVVIVVALAAVAITALLVHSGPHNASPKTSNIPQPTQPATSTSVPSTATPPTTSTPTASPPTGTGGVPKFVDCVYFSTPPPPATYPTQI